MAKVKHWLYHVSIGFDQLFNAFLCGHSDETLSSRTYRKAVLAKQPKKRWRVIFRVVETLFFWERGKHCQMAYNSEKNRKQLPPEFQEAECRKSN